MKGKFSSMWRVVIALVLVAGLSLVAAVPAAALTQPTVTVSPAYISTGAVYTIQFTVAKEIPKATGRIVVTFPTATDITAITDAADVDCKIGASSGIGTAAFASTQVVSAKVGQVLTINPGVVANDIGVGASVLLTIGTTNAVVNPPTIGSYTLTVATEDPAGTVLEAAVTSATYSITAPVVGGTVEVYNDADVPVLMETFAGTDAVTDAVAAYGSKAGYTIEVGHGTYTPSSSLEFTGEGLIFKGANYGVSPVTGTRGAESIIKSSASNYIIHPNIGGDVTIDGFTIKPAASTSMGIYSSMDGTTIRNNIFSGIMTPVILDSAFETVTSGTIDNNTFVGEGTSGDEGIEVNAYAYSYAMSGVTISNNTLSNFNKDWGAITLKASSAKMSDMTVTGNTVTDCLGFGLHLKTESSKTMDSIDVTNNTFSGCGQMGIKICGAASTYTNVIITGNDITDNTGVGILIEKWDITNLTSAIKFNNVTDNDTTHGYGLQNASGGAVDATHNWWGTSVASEVAAMINDVTSSDVTDYTPFLTDTVDAVFSATAVDTSVASLDAETEVGVVVAGTGYTTPYVVSAAKYIANPGAPLDNALAFYDVYVTGTGTATDTITVMLKFYAEDADAYADASLRAWSSSTENWVEVIPEADFSDFGGFLHVTLNTTGATTPSTPNIGDLSGTPFAVCGVEVWDPMVYDVDGSGVIEKDEALAAVADYFADVITKAQALEVIALYFE